MKKTLVALAAMAATGAFAQVTITGVADAAYGTKSVTSGTGTVIAQGTGMFEGLNAGNRINFSASTDLDGGMKARAVIELGYNLTDPTGIKTRAGAAGVNVNTGDIANGTTNTTKLDAAGEVPSGSLSTTTNRQSYVALSGGFGEVRAGYMYTTLYETSTLSGHMVGSENYGSLVHTIGNSAVGGTRSRAIAYHMPSFNGVSVAVQMGSGSGLENFKTDAAAGLNGYTGDNNERRLGVKLDYSSGPLNTTYAFTNYTRKATLGTTATAFDWEGVGQTAPTASDYVTRYHQLGANYTIGPVKFAGTINSGRKSQNSGAAGTTYASSQVGVVYTMDKVGLFAKVGNGKIATEGAAATNDITEQQMGVRYAFGKTTTGYLMTGQSRDSAATTAVQANKASMWGIGMMQTF